MALPCLQGGLGVQESPISPSGAETMALTLLTGLPHSPGSQRSKTAKGQTNRSKDLSPCYREVAQHSKFLRAPQRSPSCSYVTSPCAHREVSLPRVPFSCPLFCPTPLLALPFHTPPLFAFLPASAKEEKGH